MSFLCSENLNKTPRSLTTAVVSKQLWDPTGRWCQGRNTHHPQRTCCLSSRNCHCRFLRKGLTVGKGKTLEVLLLLQKRESWRLCRPAIDIQREAGGETAPSESKEGASQNCFVSHLQSRDKKPGPSPMRRVFQIRLFSPCCWSPRQKRTDKTMTLRWVTQIISVYPMLMSKHPRGICFAII